MSAGTRAWRLGLAAVVLVWLVVVAGLFVQQMVTGR